MSKHLTPGTLLHGGTYRIVRFINQGGFGCTYEAEHVTMHQRMAIKEFFISTFCNRDNDTDRVSVGTHSQQPLVQKLRDKFMQEARAVYQFNHPNIVRVTDVFEQNDTAYFVMSYINGSSIREMVDTNGPIPEDKAVKYISQIANALKYVHDKKMLHLDIKPDNIMVDDKDNAILIDFGAAKQYDEVDGHNTSTLIGQTPGYAPIEQTGNNVTQFTPATDIYSLGATLYTMVTGKNPPSSNELALDGALPPLPDSISASTRAAIEKAMQIKRALRPQDINEFLAILSVEPASSGKLGKVKYVANPTPSPVKNADATERTMPVSSGDAAPTPTPKPAPKPTPKPTPKPAPTPKSDATQPLVDLNKPAGPKPPVVPPSGKRNKKKSSKAGLVAAIIALLCIGGGVAWWLTSDGDKESKEGATNSKELVAENVFDGNEEQSEAVVAEEVVPEEEVVVEEVVADSVASPAAPAAPARTSTQTPAQTTTQVSAVNSVAAANAAAAAAAQQPKPTASQSAGSGKETFTVKGVTFTMVKVPGGTAALGARSNQMSDAEIQEKPMRDVTISSFMIGSTEVTQALWEAVMGTNPSQHQGASLPVENVSYRDVKNFIETLNEITGKKFRLPTQAEWEFAARGGANGRGYKFSGSNNLSEVAWFNDNSGGISHPVAQKKPNELGLYDMSGNLWEWVSDWFDNEYYTYGPTTNPKGPNSGQKRTDCGGGFKSSSDRCRTSFRFGDSPSERSDDMGFRLAL